jgi:hypothetical protein
MIISHRHKFIFIKTEKTAGTSLEIALSRYLGDEDIVTPIIPKDEAIRSRLGFSGPQGYRAPLTSMRLIDFRRAVRYRQWPRRFYNHIGAAEIRSKVPAEVFSGYFKFTIARHPEDRAVSFFHWVAQGSDLTFPEFLRAHGARLYRNTTIVSDRGIPLIDDFARFETLEVDIGRIGERLGLPNLWETFVGIKAKSGVRPKNPGARVCVGDPERAYIEYLCAAEYDIFGYERRSEYSKRYRDMNS